MVKARSGIYGLVFILYLLLLVLMSTFKSLEIFIPQIHALEQWFGGDKAMHFALAALLSLLACFASEQVFRLKKTKRILTILATLGACLLLDELLQYQVPSRKFDLMDLAAGYSGLLAGSVIYLLIGFARKPTILSEDRA